MVVAPADVCDEQMFQQTNQLSGTTPASATVAADLSTRTNFSSGNSNSATQIQLEAAARLINVCQEKDRNFSDLKYKLKLQRFDQPTVSGLNDGDYPSYQSLGFQDVNEFVPVRRNPLPQELLDQISRMECNCAMGLFTDVSRSWVTVDSDLFVWNYETNGDLAYYDGISNTILLLCLCKPKSNVLPANIQFVLCVVTSVDVILLGVNFFDTNGQTSTDYRWAEMNLIPEPLFKCSLDGAIVTDLCSTKNGRIFFIARDGCLYELEYQTRGLFGKHCKKINHSKSLMSYLAPSLYTFTFGKDEPLIQIVYDGSRQCLYTRSDVGSIQVFDLGVDESQISKAAGLSSSEIQHYAGQIAQTVEPSLFKPIVAISPISIAESVSINLLGVTHSGVRLYFSSHLNEPAPLTNPRPTALKLVHVRFPPGFCPNSAVARPDRIHVGLINRDTTLLASAFDEQSDVLWCLCNANFPFRQDFVETQAQLPVRGRTWVINDLKVNLVKGQSDWLSVKGYHQLSWASFVQPPMVAVQHIEMSKRFVILTPQGLHFIERLRPVDILKQLLIEFGPDSHQVRSFFHLHQPSQAGSMCILLACSTSLQEREVADRSIRALFLFGGESKLFVSGSDYDETFYGQRAGPTTSTPYSSFRPPDQRLYPELPPLDGTMVAGIGVGTLADVNLSTIFTEGRPTGSTEVKFSDRHNAFYIYFSRILGPLWQMHLITERNVTYSAKKTVVVLDSAFSSEELTWFVEQLKCFLELLKKESIIPNPASLTRGDVDVVGSLPSNTTQRFLNFMRGEPTSSVAQTQQQVSKKRQAEAANVERQSLIRLSEISRRCYEVLGLWKVLTDHQMHVVIGLLPKDLQDLVKIMRFNELVINGKELCSHLVACLMSQYLSDRATTDAISSRLRQVCPSLFTSDDATSAKANELLVTSRSVDDDDERKLAMDQALTMYKKVANQIHLPTVCAQLQEAQNFDGIVDLCLCAARKFDEADVGVQYYRRSDPDLEEYSGQRQIFSNRMFCYKCMTDVMNYLLNVSTGRHPSIAPQQAQIYMENMIKTAFRSDDELCHVAVFDWMFERDMNEKILQCQSPHVENYLHRRVSLASFPASMRYMDLLWKFYEQSRRYLPAAQLLVQLAESPSTIINLEQRLTYLSRAVLCAKAAVDASADQAELLHDLEDKLEVVKLQMQIVEALKQIQPTTNHIREALTKLNAELLDVTQLYNDFAEEFDLPECKLAIIHCAGHYDSLLIENLWREIIEKELSLRSHENVDTKAKLVGSKVSMLAKIYYQSPRFFPRNFLLKYLFEKSVENRFNPTWLAETFLPAGVSFGELIKTLDPSFRATSSVAPKDRKRQIYILQSLADAIARFVQNYQKLSEKERKRITTDCLDYISNYIVELQTMPSGSETVSLRQKFSSLQNDLETLSLR